MCFTYSALQKQTGRNYKSRKEKMGLRLDWQIVFFLHCYLSHLHRFCLEHMFETLSLMFGGT